jgi:hypothetical protein
MRTQVYKEFASRINALVNCDKSGNHEWADRHSEAIRMLLGVMPSGGGIDSGVRLDHDKTTGEKLVFSSSYHLMDESGYYVRWIDFQVIVTPSLQFGFNVNVRGNFGRDQDTKNYLIELFDEHLRQEIDVEYNKECDTLVISRSR